MFKIEYGNYIGDMILFSCQTISIDIQWNIMITMEHTHTHTVYDRKIKEIFQTRMIECESDKHQIDYNFPL